MISHSHQNSNTPRDFFYEKLTESLTFHNQSRVVDTDIYEHAHPYYSFRIHPHAPNPEQIASSVDAECTPISYCPRAFYAPHKPRYNEITYFQNHQLYPQEPSSLFCALFFQQIQTLLPPDPICLDMCAAPAGKALLLHDSIPTSLVVANEIDGKRNGAMQETIYNWNTTRMIATQGDASIWGTCEQLFDFMLVDAPCSGEGMIRKMGAETFFKEYSPSLVAQCAARQKNILNQVLPTLKVGGYILYVTCTFNLDENEKVVKYACEHLGLSVVPHSILMPSLPYDAELPLYTSCGTVRFYPHLFKGEGLCATLLVKNTHYSIDARQHISPLKRKRTIPHELIQETRHPIISTLRAQVLGTSLDTDYHIYKRNISHADITKPVVLYAILRICVPLVSKIQSHGIKITYPGKPLATVGKQVETTLRLVTQFTKQK